MNYFLRTVVGLGLLLGAAVYLAYDIYQLLQIGTCATGGPYVPARECPDGTARLGWTIPFAVILMLVGTFIYATRGEAPGSEPGRPRVNAVILLWCAIFLGIAFAALWGVWGPEANPGPGAKEGGLIVGFLFVLMGGAAIPFLLTRGAARPRLVPSGLRADPVSKIERLNRLRAEGAITDEEYERLKRDVVEGGR